MSRRKRAHQLVDQVADQAEALVEHVTPHVEAARESLASAAATAAAKSPVGPKPKKRRGRTAAKLLVLAGIGTALGTWLRKRSGSPASVDRAPAPAPATTVPPQPNPPVEADPVPPGAVGEHHPAPEDLARLEDEAPLAAVAEPPTESLSSFFSDVPDESGSRRR